MMGILFKDLDQAGRNFVPPSVRRSRLRWGTSGRSTVAPLFQEKCQTVIFRYKPCGR
jgi:hypothetical protein